MSSHSLSGQPLAHLDESGNEHLLIDHLREVAALAQEFAEPFGSGRWAYVTGLWHDLGKYAAGFQRMLATANGYAAHIESDGVDERDHSTAGAIHAAHQAKLGGLGKQIAFAIAGHHAGLSDKSDLDERLQRPNKQQLYECALRGGGADVLSVTPPETLTPAGLKTEDAKRFLDLWTRMIFSALCDADFLDTERFFQKEKAEQRTQGPELCELDRKLASYMELLEQKSNEQHCHKQASEPREVNRVRREIRLACEQSAKKPKGVFSLTVPTGGGKTLAAMTFALAHAQEHGQRRVIVAIPYTSIIEQNAKVYRDVFGEDAVLEHHSALEPDKETPRTRIAGDNWDAPIVVTTTVQLFESLFGNRPSVCRKLHRMVGSVIILDEAQTLPPALLAPILDMLDQLVRFYSVSVVFSTATQPAFLQSRLPKLAGNGRQIGFANIEEIVPSDVRAFERLRRTRTVWGDAEKATPYITVAQELAALPDVLAIVHRRDDARMLCELVDKELGHTESLHLSALMCPQHRSLVLSQIKERKSLGQPVRLIATQLVEAGVDLDFAVVYRTLAGLDSLAQAAGRCNREGKLPTLGELRVFRAETQPPPGVPRQAMAVTIELLRSGSPPDLQQAEPFQSYFSRLYSVNNLDAKEILSDRDALRFKTVAQKFQLIEDGFSAPLVIPFAKGHHLLHELRKTQPSRRILRQLQRYTINVPTSLRDVWLKQQIVEDIHGVIALRGEYMKAYDDRFGLVPSRMGIADAASYCF